MSTDRMRNRSDHAERQLEYAKEALKRHEGGLDYHQRNLSLAQHRISKLERKIQKLKLQEQGRYPGGLTEDQFKKLYKRIFDFMLEEGIDELNLPITVNVKTAHRIVPTGGNATGPQSDP